MSAHPMWNVELHCHTYWSKDSLASPRALLEVCRQRGIDRLAVTDHNTLRGAVDAADWAPGRFIVGEEILTTEGELLGYFMTEEIPASLTPQETIDRLRRQGAVISVAHTYDYARQGAWREEVFRPPSFRVTPSCASAWGGACPSPRFPLSNLGFPNRCAKGGGAHLTPTPLPSPCAK